MAVDFDGNNDYITIVEGTGLDGNTAMTWMVWVMFDVAPSGQPVIFCKYGGTAAEKSYWLEIGDTYFMMTIKSSTDKTTQFYHNIGSFTTGIWYHFAVTYDGATKDGHLYINGDEVSVDGGIPGNAENIRDTATILRIGIYYDGSKDLNGKVAHAAMFNKVLPAGMIKSFMYTRIVYNTDLVAYWPMDEMSDNQAPGGTDIADVTGNGHNGTFVDNTSWADGPPISIIKD